MYREREGEILDIYIYIYIYIYIHIRRTDLAALAHGELSERRLPGRRPEDKSNNSNDTNSSSNDNT